MSSIYSISMSISSSISMSTNGSIWHQTGVCSSPVPMKLMGDLVAATADNAPPPLAWPSILVTMTWPTCVHEPLQDRLLSRVSGPPEHMPHQASAAASR